jgi:hypothetical protein
MKRLSVFIFAFLCVGLIFAERNVRERFSGKIGPATSGSAVTIAAQSGNLNCLSGFDVISNSTYTFRVLRGNTTDYQLLLGASSGVMREFPVDDMFCTDPNQTMTLKVDNGTYNINYQGVVVNP